MAYGKIKADAIVYDDSGSDVEVTTESITNKANSASPTFTGTVTIPTPTAGDNSTKAASTAFVVNAFAPKASPTFTGTITGAALTLSGNLTVNGTTTTVNSATLNVTDKNIVMAKGAANDAAADGGGITVESGGGDKTFNWVDATDAWTSSEHIHVGDNKKLLLGSGSDLQLYHNGTDSYIADAGTGDLYISSNKFKVNNAASDETMAIFTENGSVDLYYDASKKFETTTDGAKVTGELQIGGTSGAKLAHSGTNSIYESQTAGDALVFKTTPSGGASTTALTISNAQNATFAGTVSDSKGNLRSIPANAKTGAYTLIASDAGKFIPNTTGGWTIPNSVMSTGDAVTLINDSGSDQTITQGTNHTIYNTADGTTGNRTLAARGIATLIWKNSSVSYISGAGLS